MNKTITLLRPVVSRGVRYRWDEVRQEHQLVYPEGMLVLNETAAAVVRLCDGRSLININHELAKSYPNSHSQDDVLEFLLQLAAKGLIRDRNDA